MLFKKNTWTLGCLCLNFLVPLQVAAADDNIENIVVEATRLQQSRYEVGSSVHVIQGRDIEAAGYDFVVDALAAAPGVTINQNGTFGGNATVRIRGASSDQTLVLIDGVVVNDASTPGGGFNFARLDPDSIARIEILSGPQSTLWGSDAIGGVVSIVTKQPTDGFQGSAFLEYGSQASARGGVSISGGNERGDFRLAVSSTDSDGISKADEDNGNSEEDGYEATTLSARGGLNLPGESTLEVSLIQTSAEAEFDSFSFGSQGNVGDGDELSETEELSGQISLTLPAFEGNLLNTLSVGYSEIDRDNLSNGAPSFSAEGDRQIYRYHGQYRINDSHKLAFGAEREDTEAGDNDTRIDSFYGLYEVKPFQDLTLTVGIRSDDIESGNTETTHRAAVAYQVNNELTLRGSWGEGFKAPSLFQNTFFCCGAVAPNPLQAEESEAYDIGLDWRSASGATTASLTYFDQDTKNQIDFSFAVGGYENIARVESQGVELSVKHELTDAITVDLSYAYIDAEDGDGNPLVRIPDNTADLLVSYQVNEKLSLSALIRYNDEELDSNGTVDNWTRGDLAGQYQLTENWMLFARVENVTDTEYQQILGYGTPDRSYSLGLRTRF